MVRSLRTLTLATLLAMGGLVQADESLLSDDSVRSYEMAMRDLKAGKAPRAAAVLKGLLLDRVRVAIDADTVKGRDAEALASGVRNGIAAWRKALPDSPFLFVPSDTPADVVVRFVPRIDNRSQLQGLVRAERRFFFHNGQSGYELNGEILLRDNAFGRNLTPDEISRVAAHELGHLLGLDDRYESQGLMGAFTPGPGRCGPTTDELQAVLKFRRDTRNALEKVVAAQKAKRPQAASRRKA